MATEYRLSYTAQEIDERLRKTDELEHKQDKLTFDSVPTEGSENLVKSGDIYTAIQNATPNLTFDETPTEGSENLVKSGAIHAALQNVGGGESLTAGNLIEIKDGVIRSTLGDSFGVETKLEIFYDSGRLVLEDSYIDEEDIEDGKVWAEYCYTATYQPTFLDKPENEGELVDLDVKYYPPDSGKFVILKSLMMYEYDTKDKVDRYEVYINAKLGEDDIEINDLNYPAISIQAENPYRPENENEYINEFEIGIGVYGYGALDISGARIVIDKEEIVEKFVTLPDNALTAGNLTKIENGVVSSLLGEEIVTEVDKEILNTEIFEMENIEAAYTGTFENTYGDITVGSAININITLPNEGTPTAFNVVVEPTAIGDVSYATAYCNCTLSLTEEGLPIVTKLDNNIPGFVVVFLNDDSMIQLLCADDYTGASIIISIKDAIATVVKLPNTALTFDEEPTEGSENLVSSGSVYEAIQNVKPELTFDNVPIQYSKNLVNSGTVYTAIQQSEQKSEQKIPTAITNYISTNSKAQGASIGKKYSTMGGEIFNDYSNNVASTVYTHAEGYHTTASGSAAHAEGNYTTASGSYSHAEGNNTIARGSESHVQGRYNIEDTSNKYAHIVGNGTSSVRSNAHTLDWNGNAWFAGNVEGMGIIADSVEAKGMVADSIETNSLIVPGKEVITEIVSGSGYSNTGSIVGQRLLSLGQEYLVVYNGVEHRLTCFENTSGTEYVIGDEYMVGHELNQTEFGFRISQNNSTITNVATLNSSDTISLSKIEASKIDLVDYIKDFNPTPNLTYDEVPTEGSENLVNSGSVYTAIQNATPNLTYDEVPTEGSENLVNSGALYNILGDISTILAEINAKIGGAE